MEFRYRHTVQIAAAPERVWAVLADVEQWPRWTPTIDELEVLDGPFGSGARVRIKQPGLPRTTWVVTAFQPLEGFTWTTSGPGVRTEGRHEMRSGGGTVTVELTLTQSGALSWLVHLLAGRMSRRYVRQEGESLKARCETGRPGA